MSTEADIVAELMAVVRTLEQHGLSKNGRVVRSAVKELERLRDERDAAARDMRERCVELVESYGAVQDIVAFQSDNDAHVAHARSQERAAQVLALQIRDLPLAVIATERTDGGV